MGNFDDCCICFGMEARRPFPSVPQQTFQPSSQLLFHACIMTFTTTFEACEAPFFQRETVLQVPGQTLLRENAKITPEEFVAEEDLHCGNRKRLIVDKVNKDYKTIHTSNLPDPPDERAVPDESIRCGPLIFDPLPPVAIDGDVPLAATDDQAKLMQWHYCLGHLSFQKLKQLAVNGKIPKKLPKLKPPKCAACLFGAMTKLPWRGKESAFSHEILVATKPGDIVSVNYIESTEVGFFLHLKGLVDFEIFWMTFK